jgi:hypothetical protein
MSTISGAGSGSGKGREDDVTMKDLFKCLAAIEGALGIAGGDGDEP